MEKPREIARREAEQALSASREGKRADAARACIEIARPPVPRCEECGKPSPRRINVGEVDGVRKVCEDCFTLWTGYG